MMLNTWSHVQAHLRKNRQEYQSARYSDSDSAYHSTITNATETYSNDATCYGSVPAPIDWNITWRIIGDNVNGLKPYGDMEALITVAEILGVPQVETIAFSETNTEWHKFQLCDNMR
jgi:hypothetical protein